MKTDRHSAHESVRQGSKHVIEWNEDDARYVPEEDRQRVQDEVDRTLTSQPSNPKYQCSSCQDNYKKTQVLPIRPNYMSWQGTFLQVCYQCLQCEKFTLTEASAPEIEDDTFHMDRDEYSDWVKTEKDKESWEIVCETVADSWVCPQCSNPTYTVTNYPSRPRCRYCDFKRPNAEEMWIAIAHNYAMHPTMGPRPRQCSASFRLRPKWRELV